MTLARLDRVDWTDELPSLLGLLLAPLAAAGIGGVATTASVNTWYATLRKPRFNPPNWIFGPVWSTLDLLMGQLRRDSQRRDLVP